MHFNETGKVDAGPLPEFGHTQKIAWTLRICCCCCCCFCCCFVILLVFFCFVFLGGFSLQISNPLLKFGMNYNSKLHYLKSGRKRNSTYFNALVPKSQVVYKPLTVTLLLFKPTSIHFSASDRQRGQHGTQVG